MSTSSVCFLSILIIVNPGCIKPIRRFQIRILSRIADAHDGIGLYILGQAQELRQSGLSGSTGSDAHPACDRSRLSSFSCSIFLSAMLRMDFLFAIASIIIFRLM